MALWCIDVDDVVQCRGIRGEERPTMPLKAVANSGNKTCCEIRLCVVSTSLSPV